MFNPCSDLRSMFLLDPSRPYVWLGPVFSLSAVQHRLSQSGADSFNLYLQPVD
ncbi:hypothetical protein BT96DRAFT_197164 [Gymnopus androsaceus JB14]|uniref:Uncharacterized protein n=1 Tax=Gymnopus androsaceus JB14 TaxID=1447944 RepID=A0A6A4H8Q6_9AGAR|nr:hypothetical protein BT96DRAFT_197164 [Gymnopus androsaceus JB14]